MKKSRLKFLLLLIAVTTAFSSFGQEDCIPKKPARERLVNDFADILQPVEENELENKLVNFNDTTSTQIAVVTVNSLCGYDRAAFTYKIGESWGVGNAQFDNGIVIMVKPKMGSEKGEAFIATGYGLEGVLPDAIAKRIIENEMIPHFKKGNMNEGITAAADVIMQITAGEYSAGDYEKSTKKSFPILPLLIFLGAIFLIIFSNVRRVRKYGRANNLGFWAALALLNASSMRHRGSYGHFSSGSGGFGGGGGFGGFGGGSFGGGGAGGSW